MVYETSMQDVRISHGGKQISDTTFISYLLTSKEW